MEKARGRLGLEGESVGKVGHVTATAAATATASVNNIWNRNELKCLRCLIPALSQPSPLEAIVCSSLSGCVVLDGCFYVEPTTVAEEGMARQLGLKP